MPIGVRHEIYHLAQTLFKSQLNHSLYQVFPLHSLVPWDFYFLFQLKCLAHSRISINVCGTMLKWMKEWHLKNWISSAVIADFLIQVSFWNLSNPTQSLCFFSLKSDLSGKQVLQCHRFGKRPQTEFLEVRYCCWRLKKINFILTLFFYVGIKI